MKHHPDDYNGLLDWEIYGPKDPEISQLVYQLAYGKQLRLVEIESVIKEALRQRIAECATSSADQSILIREALSVAKIPD